MVMSVVMDRWLVMVMVVVMVMVMVVSVVMDR